MLRWLTIGLTLYAVGIAPKSFLDALVVGAAVIAAAWLGWRGV